MKKKKRGMSVFSWVLVWGLLAIAGFLAMIALTSLYAPEPVQSVVLNAVAETVTP